MEQALYRCLSDFDVFGLERITNKVAISVGRKQNPEEQRINAFLADWRCVMLLERGEMSRKVTCLMASKRF